MNAKEKRELLKKQEMEKRTAKMKQSDIATKPKEEKVSVSSDAKLANVDTKKERKRIAKSINLKSIFVLEDGTMASTSEGKGRKVLIEKTINKTGIVSNITPEQYKLENKTAKTFTATAKTRNEEKKEIKVAVNNPVAVGKTGMDVIRRKPQLEQMFFGKTFNDNIHIQIAYNILDISKILCPQLNNIIYTLNNVTGKRGLGFEYDVIGMKKLVPYNSYEHYKKFLEDNKNNLENIRYNNPYAPDDSEEEKCRLGRFMGSKGLLCFGDTFYKIEEKGAEIKSEKEIYTTINAIAAARQFVAHGTDKNITKDLNDEENNINQQTIIYSLGAEYDSLFNANAQKARKEIRKLLDNIYSLKIIELNKTFLENSKVDVQIINQLPELRGNNDIKQICRDYYDFIMRKNYKKLGFSIRKIREELYSLSDFSNNEIIKNKLQTKDNQSFCLLKRCNKLLDYYLYVFYIRNEQRSTMLIDDLRFASNDDEQKNKIYSKEANFIWNNCKGAISNLLSNVNLNTITNLRDKVFEIKEINSIANENWKPMGTADSYFSKYIYLFSLFLDGKEINDMLTQLIDKIQNIASLIEVTKETGCYCPFVDIYKLFENSVDICTELENVNSFARMKDLTKGPDSYFYYEALRMLGTEEINSETNQLFGENMDDIQKNIKNFVKNNVIKSKRFKYLTKYSDATFVKAFTQNNKLVRFVLETLPKEQIIKYYNSCRHADVQEYSERLINSLTEEINALSFDGLKKKLVQGYKTVPDEEGKKYFEETFKNIVGLYFTTSYLFVKNLIYVNTRYFLAFYCLERDSNLYDLFSGPNGKKLNFGYTNNDVSYSKLLRLFLRESYIKANKKAQENSFHNPLIYLNTNLSNSNDWVIKTFRNKTEHLNAVGLSYQYLADIKSFYSYFEIYHYLMQRLIFDEYNHELEKEASKTENGIPFTPINVNNTTMEYFNKVNSFNCYSKDFVKAMCIPFGYNLARYKNLTIDKLFDRNDTRKLLSSDD